MSHYTTMETVFVSGKHLVLALEDLGFGDVEVYEEAQPLVGWLGDGRGNRAEVIIRRKHMGPSSNDIGFAVRSDGRFEALISDFDRKIYGPLWLGRLTQRYAYRVARDTLAEQDFELVEERVGANGQIHLCVRRVA